VEEIQNRRIRPRRTGVPTGVVKQADPCAAGIQYEQARCRIRDTTQNIQTRQDEFAPRLANVVRDGGTGSR
jgi:hypothetical protein